jgi:hypothetical protein
MGYHTHPPIITLIIHSAYLLIPTHKHSNTHTPNFDGILWRNFERFAQNITTYPLSIPWWYTFYHLFILWRQPVLNGTSIHLHHDHRFGKEFTTAVEQKQIAQQDAERAKFVVEKAEQERQAAVIRAEGEAEAANTISAAINRAGDAFVQFRKIEASREIGEYCSYCLDMYTFKPTTYPLAYRSHPSAARQS